MYLSIYPAADSAAMPAACSTAVRGDRRRVPMAMQYSSSCSGSREIKMCIYIYLCIYMYVCMYVSRVKARPNGHAVFIALLRVKRDREIYLYLSRYLYLCIYVSMYLCIYPAADSAAMPAACSAADQGDRRRVPMAMQYSSSCSGSSGCGCGWVCIYIHTHKHTHRRFIIQRAQEHTRRGN